MGEKYLVSLQDLHDWYFHSLPFGETEKLDRWFEDHEFHDDTNYEQRYDEGYRAGLQAARDYMDEIAKESSITSIKDVFRVSSPSKAINQKQKQAVDVFLKAMNENKQVLEIVNGEFVVKKKESGKD